MAPFLHPKVGPEIGQRQRPTPHLRMSRKAGCQHHLFPFLVGLQFEDKDACSYGVPWGRPELPLVSWLFPCVPRSNRQDRRVVMASSDKEQGDLLFPCLFVRSI